MVAKGDLFFHAVDVYNSGSYWTSEMDLEGRVRRTWLHRSPQEVFLGSLWRSVAFRYSGWTDLNWKFIHIFSQRAVYVDLEVRVRRIWLSVQVDSPLSSCSISMSLVLSSSVRSGSLACGYSGLKPSRISDYCVGLDCVSSTWQSSKHRAWPSFGVVTSWQI